MTLNTKLCGWALVSVLAVGCGSEDDPDVLGIYQVKTHTVNEAACDAEGPAVTDQDGYFLMNRYSAFGITYYQATACASLEECRAEAKSKMPSGSFWFTFDQPSGATRLNGSVRTTGFTSSNGICTEPEVSQLSFVRTGNDVRIEKRTAVGDDYPETKDGYCTTELGEKATRGKPCSELEVMTATFVEPLP